jgi:hypothetical protein
MEFLTKMHEGVTYTEEWRPISGLEGIYEVSSFGRVKSLKRNIILKKSIDRCNYYFLSLHINKSQKNFRVHVLVAIAFLGHKPDGTHKIVVDHKNNNRLDNSLQNLQLITQRENCSKAIRPNKKTNYIGVHISKSKGYVSTIRIGGKRIHLGVFKTEEEASEYYQNALKAVENGEEIVIKNAFKRSKYKGLYYHLKNKKWICRYKDKHIGCSLTEDEAFKLREEYIKQIINK